MQNAGTFAFSESYELSESSLNRIRLFRKPLKDNIAKANPAWAQIFGKVNLESETDETSEESDESTNNENVEAMDVTSYQFSQFYTTQIPLNLCENEKTEPQGKHDIVLSLYECLEHTSGKLNFNLLETLSEDDLIEVVEELEKKISPTGLCNLCKSINSSNIEQRTRYGTVLLSNLILPQIVSLDTPSRLLQSTIAETVQICPDDVCTFILIPVLNADLKDTTLVTTIINAFGIPRKAKLMREFCTTVTEIRLWHIQILQDLLSIKIDENISTRLVKLFLNKASDFSKDINFGKLLLLFMKTGGALAKCHKDSLWDIINAHETVFKEPLMNILHKM